MYYIVIMPKGKHLYTHVTFSLGESLSDAFNKQAYYTCWYHVIHLF